VYERQPNPPLLYRLRWSGRTGVRTSPF
jgi:hypothetical protein